MPDRPAPTALAWIGQVLLYGLFALAIGVFSHWPAYRHLAPDQALIKLSFNRQGQPVSACRRATPRELARLPPNMRAPLVCPRERSPITVELELDGAAAFYHRIEVAAGTHRLVVRLNDDARNPGFDFVREASVTLKPAQILVIDFDPNKGGITLQ
jgi:hypothetical protein